MFCIGLHPEVQRKLQQEVDAIFGDDRERPVTADDLRRMPYLECTIKESLRLYPAGPFFARQLAEEVDVEGYRLPRGTVVWLCIMSLHMNQEVYPEPARFDPDRFAPQPSRDRHPYAYLPFSGGPRACLGHKFAMMEEKIILANVLRKFRITTLGSPDKLVLASEIILRPKCPICVTCTPR
ncbi:Cytochrome P450 4c3 [Halotydeus destructor]|nr:Cytochrome P450 4c3 [Halotydeus destructor]